MTTIAVLGAGGQTGRLLTGELRSAGHRVLEVRSDTVPALVEALEDAAILVDVTPPGGHDGGRDERPGLEAALRAGVHYLDAGLEPAATEWVHEQDARARAAGSVVVSGGGFPGGVLDLLGGAALTAAEGADELHLATTVLDRGWLRTGAGPGTRAVLADLLTRPVTAVVDGARVEEPLGEARRLAWFPRPVGLAHAAGVPGVAPLLAARRRPDLRTVREYVAMSGLRAELLQLAGNATRWAPARGWLQRRVRGSGLAPPAERRAGVRWACVAETQGSRGTVRAWANGRDPAASAAACLAVLADAVLAGGRPGVRTPAELGPPEALLDELTATRDLRWAVIRPDGP